MSDAPRASSTGTRTDDQTPRRRQWGPLVGRAMRLEKHMYASLARGVARRPAVPEGARGFRYDAATRLVLVVLVVLSAVELVVVDVLVHRWPLVRVPLLVLGIWGVVWMLGLLFAHTMRPHTVGPHGMRVRDGLDLDLDLPWDDVHSVGLRRRSHPPKSPRVVAVDDRSTVVVPVSDQTNVRVVLERPTRVVLPGVAPKGGEHLVEAVELWADEPRELLEEVRRHL